MTTAAVILAGGRGTRSVDPNRAKVTQTVGGASLLEWHYQLIARSSIDECLVVAGHLGHQVQELSDQVTSGDFPVQVIHEPEQRGTVAAVELAAKHTSASGFIVILGDVLMSVPLDQILNEWTRSGRGVLAVVHPSSHPHDSDAVFTESRDTVLVIPKHEQRAGIPNMASAGLFGLNRGALQRYSELTDIGSDVLPAAAAEHDLLALVSSHYLKDTGTPERLSSAVDDFESGLFKTRGRLEPRPAVFLDRDGVINPSQPVFLTPDDYLLLPGVAEAIGKLNSRGIPAIVITNQPHIAKGHLTFEQHTAIRARMDTLLANEGAFVDDYFFCPHHPDSGFVGEVAALKGACDCRKPAPGLVRQACELHILDISTSVMVGDTDRDRDLALACGMAFVRVDYNHSSHSTDESFTSSADAIKRALEIASC